MSSSFIEIVVFFFPSYTFLSPSYSKETSRVNSTPNDVHTALKLHHDFEKAVIILISRVFFFFKGVGKSSKLVVKNVLKTNFSKTYYQSVTFHRVDFFSLKKVTMLSAFACNVKK